MKEFEHIDWERLKPYRESIINPDTGKPFLQKEVAAKADMKQSYLSRIENGDMTSPNRKFVEAIAKALGVEMSQLLSECERVKSKTDSSNSITPAYSTPAPQIPKYSQLYNPKGFRYSDGILMENQDWVERPYFLKNEMDAYAFVVNSRTMEPRYHVGDTLFVNPNVEPTGRDDVILIFEHNNRKIGVLREVVEVTDVEDLDSGKADPAVEVIALQKKLDINRINFRPEGTKQPEIGDLQAWFDDDQEHLRSNSDGPYLLNEITVHVVVGSYKHRLSSPRHVTVKVEGVSATLEMGTPAITVHRADKT